MTDKKSKGTTRKPAPSATTTPGPNLSPEMLSQSGINSSLSVQNPLLAAAMFGQTLGGEADASDEIAELAPTFGEVLRSIGMGVATSQASLDAGLVRTAKKLSDTKIELVTQVIQQLDEDGLPDAAQTELVTKQVSLINYINPQAHEWTNVSLSMDFNVGEMDNESGVTFSRKQSSYAISGGVRGGFWGFVGWFNASGQTSSAGYSAETDREVEWANGQVRMDAMLQPRRTGKFPVPAEVTIGPQISFAQGSVVDLKDNNLLTGRKLTLTISVRKADGSPNAQKDIEVNSDRFSIEFLDNDNNGLNSKTNDDGIIIVSVKRNISNPLYSAPIRGNVTANLGQISRSMSAQM